MGFGASTRRPQLRPLIQRLYYPGMAVMKAGQCSERRTWSTSQLLFEEGEMGFEMFIVHAGRVEVL